MIKNCLESDNWSYLKENQLAARSSENLSGSAYNKPNEQDDICNSIERDIISGTLSLQQLQTQTHSKESLQNNVDEKTKFSCTICFHVLQIDTMFYRL
jgi:hypothetical protein